MKKFRIGAACAITATLAIGGVSALASDAPPAGDAAVPAADAGDQGGSPDALASNCKKTFNSGAGLTRFSWCFSNDGNIVKIEHSAGLEHVRIGSFIEGFCLSSNGALQGSSLSDIGNTGLFAPTFPSATKVRHITTNGVWQIDQTFAQNTGSKTITVTMALKNISGAPQNSVFLTRELDADMSNTVANDVFTAASRSVSASEPGSSRLVLAAGNASFPTNTLIYPSAAPVNNNFCYDAPSDSVNNATGDRSMGVLQQLPNVAPNGTVTTKFTYQVSI